MALQSAWMFLGKENRFLYKLYNLLRNWLNSRLASYLVKQALMPSANIVLEAGAGLAYSTSLLSKNPLVKLSVALDYDKETLIRAKQRDRSIVAVIGDIFNMPFKTESFDLIWNNSTLEHLDDSELALKKMIEVVNPQGSIFVGVPYKYGPLGICSLIKNSSFCIWVGPTYSSKDIRELFERSGLKILKEQSFFFKFFVSALGIKNI